MNDKNTIREQPLDRLKDPVFQKRREVIHGSQMHADAVAICLLARTLKRMADDFIYDYTPDASFDLFVANKCHLPSDIAEEGWDPNRNWSGWVHDDVSGRSE